MIFQGLKHMSTQVQSLALPDKCRINHCSFLQVTAISCKSACCPAAAARLTVVGWGQLPTQGCQHVTTTCQELGSGRDGMEGGGRKKGRGRERERNQVFFFIPPRLRPATGGLREREIHWSKVSGGVPGSRKIT